MTVKACVWILAIILSVAGPAVSAQPPAYLADTALRETLIGHTLIGKDWAEYYEKDGSIRGRARYFGIAFDYTGTWKVTGQQVCYEYERKDRNTCSFLIRDGDVVRHFTTTGSPKFDGVARRVEGNRTASL